MAVLGLDIGGANLKAALATGEAQSLPFALWRAPGDLAERLRTLLTEWPHDRLAVTMTGELCDCFATKREGVHAILDSVARAAPDVPARIWSTAGHLVSIAEARADPWRVASANWHALATFAGRFVPRDAALLIDIGSTTADIIPLWSGLPAPRAFTDPERLASGELAYAGVRRTPLCAILGNEVAAELFATTLDAYLLLGLIDEESHNRETADGRPATKRHAHARMARMSCNDTERFSREAAAALAERVQRLQVSHLTAQARRVAASLPKPPEQALLAGEGEFLARTVLAEIGIETVVSLRDRIGATASAAACAYAVAVLAEETGGSL